LDLGVRDKATQDKDVTELLAGAASRRGGSTRVFCRGDGDGAAPLLRECTGRVFLYRMQRSRCLDRCSGLVVRGAAIGSRGGVIPVFALQLHSGAPTVASQVAKFMGTSVTAENLQTDHPNPTTTQFALLATGNQVTTAKGERNSPAEKRRPSP
jgi:hypothetical protein